MSFLRLVIVDLGVDLDFETVGGNGSMLMVTAGGTAVFVES